MRQKLQNLFFLFLLGTIGAKAQPVITAAGCNPVIGERFKVQSAIDSTVSPPDSGGVNRVWDYSNLKNADSIVFSVVPPKGLLYADSFPSANFALQYNVDTSKFLLYENASDSSWGDVGLLPGINDTNSIELYSYNPILNRIVYPMSYKKLYTISLLQQTSYYNGSWTNYSPYLQHDTLYADGYGTLKLPNAIYNNVLRVYSGEGYNGMGDYYFYVNGVHWPVLILNSYLNYANSVFWTAHYYVGTPLPLQISSFTAAWQNKMPYLQWEAANTENTKQFNIQRSADGHSFETVGQVGVNGASYHFVDNYIPTSTVYYRLQQVDKNGQTFYSSTAKLTVNSKQLTVFPNPAKGTIHVSVPSASPVYVMIYDAIGRLVYENKNYSSAQPIATDSWNKGTYLVRVKDSEGWKVSSFVIEN